MCLIWYIIRTGEGKEESILQACRKHLPADLLNDAFVFHYEKMMRFGGAWHLVKRPMFPGYVFLETFWPETFLSAAKQFAPVFDILNNGEETFAVTDEEERFLKMLCGEEHLLRMSYGSIKNGHFLLESGPLRGHEELIAKVDRHKRSAAVRICIGGTERIIWAGLEIREKIVSEDSGRLQTKADIRSLTGDRQDYMQMT